jgi:hypothetical protein
MAENHGKQLLNPKCEMPAPENWHGKRQTVASLDAASGIIVAEGSGEDQASAWTNLSDSGPCGRPQIE